MRYSQRNGELHPFPKVSSQVSYSFCGGKQVGNMEKQLNEKYHPLLGWESSTLC